VSNLQLFASSDAKSSFIPSIVSVDPENNRVYVMDAGAGTVAGVDLKDGELSVACRKIRRHLASPRSSARRITGAHRYRHPDQSVPTAGELQDRSRLVARRRYRQRARPFERVPKMTQRILVTPGYASLQYFLTADGHIVGLQVTPAGG
jgi:hypothetical protein